MKLKQSKKQLKTTRPNRPLVYYTHNGERFIGELTLVSHSTVDPKYDVAYIDFPNHWKVALLSEINYVLS